MLHDFFYFPKSDRRAIVVLAITGVLCVAVLLVIDTRKTDDTEVTDTPKEKTEESINPSSLTHSINPTERASADQTEVMALHRFDPNTADSSTLIGLGLKHWQVRNLLKYRRAGGIFRTPESISKLYGWTQEDIDRLLPYVYIGKEFAAGYKSYNRTAYSERQKEKDTLSPRQALASDKFQTLTKIDPNTADSVTLRRIPGIGIQISRSIIRYRERLGGFHSVNQLLDIRIFSPELLEWFEIKEPDIQAINLNEASFQKLNSHPYISYEQTRSLLRYIRLYGKIQNIEQLRSTNIFTNEEIEKLTPYITF